MATHPTVGDLQIISGIALFRSLDAQTIKRIIATATTVTLKPHAILFSQGELATAFFVMIDGWIKHYRINACGDEAVTHVLTRGESFAESIALTGSRFPGTAEAVTCVRIVRVPADHVVRCIQANPQIALAMIAAASQGLQYLMAHVEQLKAQTGVQRLAEFLVSLARIDNGPCVIALPYDKMLIARQLSLQPESLSRTFAKLRGAGVEVRGARVAVNDVAKLRRIASEERSAIRGAFREMARGTINHNTRFGEQVSVPTV